MKEDGREYWYDGLLEGWKGKRRVRLVEYERHSPGVISVPLKLAEEIATTLADLKIDHRVIQYNKADNYFRRTYMATDSPTLENLRRSLS